MKYLLDKLADKLEGYIDDNGLSVFLNPFVLLPAIILIVPYFVVRSIRDSLHNDSW